MTEVGGQTIEAGQETREKPKRIVVEVGCGDKPHILPDRLGYREVGKDGYLIALDISQQAVKVTRNTMAEFGVEGSVMVMEAGTNFWPIQDSAVDEVIFSDVLSERMSVSMDKMIQSFNEADRILKIGGKIIIVQNYFAYDEINYGKFINLLKKRLDYYVREIVLTGQPERGKDFYIDKKLPTNSVVLCIKKPSD